MDGELGVEQPNLWRLIKVNQELYEITIQQQAEIEALKLRMDKIDGLGTAPVVIDSSTGQLISTPLWAGFGVTLLGLMSAWFLRLRKKFK